MSVQVHIWKKNENCKFSPDFISRIRKSNIFPNKKMLTICASMQPMEFRILTKSAFPDSRSITKMSQWRSNVDIDQVSFPSVDITSEGLVQKFHINPVCTGTTKVGKLQIQQRAQPKLATNQSQSFFR